MEKAHIMLVDDEPVILRMVERELGAWLRKNGHELSTHSSAREALDAINARHGAVDLLVTDLCMPDMGGVELQARVTQRWPRIVSILLTGCFDARILTQSAFSGFFSYILKPWNPGELAAEMERALARSGEPAVAAV